MGHTKHESTNPMSYNNLKFGSIIAKSQRSPLLFIDGWIVEFRDCWVHGFFRLYLTIRCQPLWYCSSARPFKRCKNDYSSFWCQRLAGQRNGSIAKLPRSPIAQTQEIHFRNVSKLLPYTMKHLCFIKSHWCCCSLAQREYLSARVPILHKFWFVRRWHNMSCTHQFICSQFCPMCI